MALARARRERGIDYWPGFVDALSTLILGIVFLLSVFVIVQFFLSQEVTGKDTALQRLNAQIAQLTELLSLEKVGKANLEDTLAVAARQPRDGRDRARPAQGRQRRACRAAAAGRASLPSQLDAQKGVTARALAQVELLNQQIAALRRQLAAIEAALEVSESKDKDAQARIADLGQRLNVALAQRVQELSRYRSEFFGRLRAILGNRPDIRVVGDRFVFQSEVFFDAGAAVVQPEGRAELDKLAAALIELEKQIPADIAWVLRVDGHTDVRPIASAQFPSNWELSAARAISVVQYLISKGISPQRLVAAGFGEFQPLEAGQRGRLPPQPPHRAEADRAVSRSNDDRGTPGWVSGLAGTVGSAVATSLDVNADPRIVAPDRTALEGRLEPRRGECHRWQSGFAAIARNRNPPSRESDRGRRVPLARMSGAVYAVSNCSLASRA